VTDPVPKRKHKFTSLRGYRTVGFSLTSILLDSHTVVWQIRDVFLIAFIFYTGEEELTKMKETMLQYVSITPAERLSNGWIFPHFYTVGFPGTVVWQIRDVFLFAFIFGTIPKSLLLGLKLPIYSGWTVDPSREACWTVSPAAASLSGTPSATCPRRPWSPSLVVVGGRQSSCLTTARLKGTFR